MPSRQRHRRPLGRGARVKLAQARLRIEDVREDALALFYASLPQHMKLHMAPEHPIIVRTEQGSSAAAAGPRTTRAAA